MAFDTRKTVQYQQQSLKDLLHYVWTHSTFYRGYYRDHGIREKDLAELAIQDLPFMTKKTLMDHFDLAVTDQRLRKEELEPWLDSNRDPQQSFQRDFIPIHSSGSSGTIGVFVYDRTAWQVMNTTMADRLPAAPRGQLQKSKVAFCVDTYGHHAGPITALEMPRAVYDTLIVSLHETPERIVRQLETFQPHRLGGYTSIVATLASWALEGKLHIRPQSVLVGAEVLTDSMERTIHEAWGVSALNLYAASESIYIAIKGVDRDEFAVMDDLNIVEILDNENQPVPPGGPGRVLLTNLVNRALPILRYEMGDYAVRGTGSKDLPFTTIREIKGRVNDSLPVVLADGKPGTIHPLVLADFYTAGLERVQFVSRSADHVEIKYMAKHDIHEGIQKEFHRIRELQGALGTTFDVQRVQTIAPAKNTGKIPLVKVSGARDGQVATPTLSHASSIIRTRSTGPTNPFIVFGKDETEQSIPQRFEQQVRQYANRLAIKNKDRELTYNELNNVANRVARTIIAHKVSEGQPIVLLLEKDISLIAAMLGVLKAGGFYLALDPALPVARCKALMADSGAHVLLTNNESLRMAREIARDENDLINIEATPLGISEEDLDLDIKPTAYAYLLYTSGSTGEPKGVLQNHRNVLHSVMNYTNDIHICSQDRMAFLNSISFSASVRDVFGALLNGAALLPYEIRHEGLARIPKWIVQEEVTVYHSIPTVFRQFVSTLTGNETFLNVRLIYLTGETSHRNDFDLYKKYFSRNCILASAIGCAEANIFRRFFMDKDDSISTRIVPVGYAVDDKDVILLNDDGRAVDVDEIGEIAIKSRYLSPGYWRRPDLTRDAFIVQSDDGEERLYRTGDIGIMQPNGCLIYLGRQDRQVKVRGQRVEIAEIETALLDLPMVKQAVVLAQEDQAGDQNLVAYVVPTTPSNSAARTLRRLLAGTLPNYMIPAAFVILDVLPITPTGKVDRQALPEPGSVRRGLDTPVVNPRTPIEQTLARIWGDLLGFDRVSIYDNFFDLGGHSLSAFQVISRVTNTFRVDVPIRTFFENPTVAGLALIIVESLAKNEEQCEEIIL